MGMTAGVIGVTAGVAGATTTNTITATAATTVHPTGTAQAGANVHVTITDTVAATTLTLTVSSAGGTTMFSAVPVVTATGFSTHTAAFTATHHKVKVTLVQTATTHTTEKVTFATVKFVTSRASGAVTIAATSTPSETFTGSPVTDANVTGTTTSRNNTIAVTSTVPTIPKTGVNQSAANLKITLHNATGSTVTTSKLALVAATTDSTGTVDWTSKPTVSCSGCTAVTVATPVTSTETITVSMAAGATATLTVTSIRYNTAGAIGTVAVTPTWKTSASTVTLGTFTPAFKVNAIATKPSPAAAPTTETITATSTPTIKPTGSGQSVGTWKVTFKGAKSKGWSKTQTFSINVFEHTGGNCTSGSHGYVLLTGTPTAKVTSSKDVSTTPTVKVTTSAASSCTAASHNQVTVTFTNSGTFTSTTVATNTFTITVSTVKYNVHKGTAQTYGNVKVGATKTTGGLIAASTTKATTGPSNANIAAVVMSGNTPAVTVTPSAFDAAISPVNVIEQVAGSIPSSDYVCVTLTPTANHFNAANTATASVKSGNGTVTATVTYYTGATKKTSGTATTAVFKVKTASSTTKPSTYKVTGLHVNASGTSGTVSVVGHYSATPHCGAAGLTGTPAGTAVAFAISIPKSKRIAGVTAAATAAAELEYEYPATSAVKCAGGVANTTTTANISARAVILANGTHFPDALSSQYLAGQLHTGTVLAVGTFGGTSVPAVTLNAIRLEGVSHVYVIGGPLAVTATVVNTLKTTPQYNCGGSSVRHTSTGATRFLTVTRIGGTTQYTTAEMVAMFLAKSHVGTGNFAPAFAGVDKTGGNGKFNDTKGNASPAGINAAQKTGVVADGQVFQDAMSAGAFAYAKGFLILLTTPSKLSPQVASAISTLTIQQVIVMGGQLAVSDAVVTSLEAQGVSVLRIGGQDYTDTAVQAADFEVAATGTGGLGWTPATHGHMAAVARGNGFSDGLAGAVVTGNHMWPLLLTENPTTTGSYLTAFLKNVGAKGFGVDETATNVPHPSATYRLSAVVIFGGTLAITPTVVKTIQTDLATGLSP